MQRSTRKTPKQSLQSFKRKGQYKMNYIELCENNAIILLFYMMIAFLIIAIITAITERKEKGKKRTQKREIKRRLSREEFSKKYNHMI